MSIHIELNRREAIEALREIATGKEDYVYVDPSPATVPVVGYVNCHYAHGDEPGCLIGHALAAQGVPIERLQHFDESANTVAGLVERGELSFSDEAVLFAWGRAQSAQDTGRSWGAAIEEAEDEIRWITLAEKGEA